MELSTALGLSTSAGLNAYIPLLAYGLVARFTDWVTLPQGFEWLANPVLLAIIAVLLVIELVADKVPAIDSVNDIIQTMVRPTSGGLMFASAFGDQTVNGSSAWSEPKTWGMLALGCAIALAMHLFKTSARPVVNTTTVGVGAPVVSTAEDVVAACLTASAIFAPVLVVVIVAAVLAPAVWLVVRLRRRFAADAAPRARATEL